MPHTSIPIPDYVATSCPVALTPMHQALLRLSNNRLGGMPVVDQDNVLVGVVSDYDLLCVDSFFKEERLLPQHHKYS